MELSGLTILSIPRGPRDVLTTSATATEEKDRVKVRQVVLRGREGEVDLFTFGSDDVSLTNVPGLFRLNLGGAIARFGGGVGGLVLSHLNLVTVID